MPSPTSRLSDAHAAFTLAHEGFTVGPLRKGKKFPPEIDFVFGPIPGSCDPKQLAIWTKEFPGCNWLARTGVVSATGRPLLVLDQDADGKVEDLPGELPDTRRVSTPNGTHYYFLLRPGERFKNSKGVVAKGWDVRAQHGYVVAPGSVVGGKRYRVQNPETPYADCPEWLYKKLKVDEEKPKTADTGLEVVASANKDHFVLEQAEPELEFICTYIRNAQPGNRGGGKLNGLVFRAGNLVAYSPLDEAESKEAVKSALRVSGARVGTAKKANGELKNPAWTSRMLHDLLDRSFGEGLVATAPPEGLPPAPEGMLLEEERPVVEREEFPEETLIGTAGEFARLCSAVTECPPEAFFFTFLTLLGSAVSKVVRLKSSLDIQPRLYTVLLGASATAKKSTAITFGTNFFRDLYPAQRALPSEADELSGAAQATETVPSPHILMLWGMGSFEGLARRAEKEKKPVLLIYDELGSFVAKSSQEGSLGLPMLCSLYESNYFDNATAKKDLKLRDGYLSLLGACTTSTYESMWGTKFLNFGFINRLNVVHCSRLGSFALPDPANAIQFNNLKDKTRKQIEKILSRPGPTIFEMTPDAKALFTKWYEARGDSFYIDRLDGLGHRYMLLLALTSDAGVIDVGIVEKVIRLLDYQLRVRVRVSPIAADNVIARMEKKIRRAVLKNPGLTYKLLKNRVRADEAGLQTFDWAFNKLVEAGEIKLDKASITVWPILAKPKKVVRP